MKRILRLLRRLFVKRDKQQKYNEIITTIQDPNTKIVQGTKTVKQDGLIITGIMRYEDDEE